MLDNYQNMLAISCYEFYRFILRGFPPGVDRWGLPEWRRLPNKKGIDKLGTEMSKYAGVFWMTYIGLSDA